MHGEEWPLPGGKCFSLKKTRELLQIRMADHKKTAAAFYRMMAGIDLYLESCELTGNLCHDVTQVGETFERIDDIITEYLRVYRHCWNGGMNDNLPY
jgi:uncharacterized membrane protein